MKRKKVYVCAPFGGSDEEIKRNTELTIKRCRKLYEMGYDPIAPQLYYPQFLEENNPVERKDGLDSAMGWLAMCDLMMIFGGRITKGMRAEINYAESNLIPTRYVTE